MALMEIWRLLLCFALCFLALRRIRRSRIKRKQAVSVISVLLILCLISLTAVFPVENLFVHFETPESAFRYTSSGTIVNTIPGRDSCLVVYSTGESTYHETIFPITELGYQLPNFYGVKTVSSGTSEHGSFDVLQYSGSNDRYVRGVSYSGDDPAEAVVSSDPIFTIPAGDGKTTLYYTLLSP